jgi:hypothetical protein
MPTYGLAIDATNEYCMLGESTTMEVLKHFAIGVRTCFESTYSRQPTRANFMKIMMLNIFWVCLHPSIACIINGRIVLLHGKVNFKIRMGAET